MIPIMDPHYHVKIKQKPKEKGKKNNKIEMPIKRQMDPALFFPSYFISFF